MNVTLHRLNLTRYNSDPCLYVRKERSEFVIIVLYFDDVIVTSNSSDLHCKVKAALKENHTITGLGELSWCLGIQVEQRRHIVRLTQRTFSRCLRNLACKISNLARLLQLVISRKIAFPPQRCLKSI